MKLQDFDFRMWSTEAKLYFEPTIELERGKVRLIPENDDSIEIELWTRFYDKNGKKIYEGDIIEITDTEDIYVQTAKVVFNSLGFVIETGSNLSDYYHRRYIIEVIGNIHENKDLNYDLVKKR